MKSKKIFYLHFTVEYKGTVSNQIQSVCVLIYLEFVTNYYLREFRKIILFIYLHQRIHLHLKNPIRSTSRYYRTGSDHNSHNLQIL